MADPQRERPGSAPRLDSVPPETPLISPGVVANGCCRTPLISLLWRPASILVKSVPHIGTVGEQRWVVESQHTIDFADADMPAVLSTPSLIWFLEHAARAAVLPCLETGESTVGTEIEVQHLAPTPVGQAVVCQARVVRVEGTEVCFQVEAWDESSKIARGYHRLRVIRKERFAARVRAKGNERATQPGNVEAGS